MSATNKLTLLALAIMFLFAGTTIPPTAVPTFNIFGVPGFTPTAAAGWTGVVMFATWMTREWRAERKLSLEDRQARREGYAKQVENLQGENRALRSDLMATEKRHTEYRQLCEQETDQLRHELREVRDEMTGIKRQIESHGTSAAHAVADGLNAPTTLKRMARKTGDRV